MAPEFRVAQEGDKPLYRMAGAAQEGSKARHQSAKAQ